MPHQILSFPADLGDNSNPYQRVIGDALAQQGAQWLPYQPTAPFQSADALHLHWPERLYQTRRIRLSGMLSELAFRNMSLTAKRIQSRGGRFVWTAHNLRPHEPPPARHAATWSRWHDRLLAQVDTVICMTEAAVDAVREGVASVRDAQIVVAPHPHYRYVYSQWEPRETTREMLRVPSTDKLICMIGYIRRYKGVAEAARAFAQVARGDEWLLIAGRCGDAELERELHEIAAKCPRIRLKLEALSPRELTSMLKASDLALFNFADILNSGSVLTALSLDIPVAAPRLGAMIELERQVGSDWCTLFPSPLTGEQLRGILDQPTPQGVPDLSLNEPEYVAAQHMRAYGFVTSPTRQPQGV